MQLVPNLNMGGIAVSSLFNAAIVITHQGGLKLIKYMDANLKEVARDLSKEVDSKAIQVRENYVMTELGSIYSVTMSGLTKIGIDIIFSSTSFLPTPYNNGNRMVIDYQVLMRNGDTLTLYDLRTQRYISVDTPLKKDDRFVDPLGNDLTQRFYSDLGDEPILEVCDTRDQNVVLRTI